MAQLTDQDMWGMYIKQLLNSPLLQSVDISGIQLAGASIPIAINTKTVGVTPVKGEEALAPLYQFGDTMPQWSLFYTPSTDSFFDQYDQFVSAIQLKGNDDPALQGKIKIDKKNWDDAKTQWTTDMTAAQAAFKSAPSDQYASWNDFLQQTPWGDTINQDQLAINAALSAYDGDMSKAYGSGFNALQQALNTMLSANNALNSGTGPYVMTIKTDAGESYVPLYNPSSLDQYSAWLDEMITQAGNGDAPQNVLTIQQGQSSYDYSQLKYSAGGGLSLLEPFMFGLDVKGNRTTTTVDTSSSNFGVTISYQGITYVSIDPGTWFNGSLLTDYTDNSDFDPNSPFGKKPIWGPGGLFNIKVTGLIIGFRPSLTLDMDASDGQQLHDNWSASAEMGFGIGPFLFGAEANASGEKQDLQWSSDYSQATFQDKTDLPRVLAVTTTALNYTPPAPNVETRATQAQPA